MSAASGGSPSEVPSTVTATESPTGSQRSTTSTFDHSSTPSGPPRKRIKTYHDDELASSGSEYSAAPPGTQPSPSMLSVELLTDVFLYLDTTQVARAAQVCSTWYAASRDFRIWRQLSFAPARHQRALPIDDLTKLRFYGWLGRRCGHTVESVDFGNLSRAAPLLAAGLATSTQSLKHIRWSSGRANLEAFRAVVQLAKCCPNLETLELRSHDTYDFQEFSKSMPLWGSPRSFTFIADGFRREHESHDLPETVSTLFDHATTLEFKQNMLQDDEPRLRWTSVRMLARFLKNQAIEKLTVHGLCLVSYWEAYALSAPSLTSLDLRWSGIIARDKLQLDAPQLRELAIDVHLLPVLTPVSTSMLSSLTLRIVAGELQGSGPWKFNWVWHHQGSLKLTVDYLCLPRMLKTLEFFVWPGLEEAEIELISHSAAELISLMAAREAGARGASSEKYRVDLFTARECLKYAQTSSDAEPTDFVDVAREIMAMATAQRCSPGTTPICSAVHWKIRVPDRINDGWYSWRNNIPTGLLDWLEEQPNVELQRSQSAHLSH